MAMIRNWSMAAVQEEHDLSSRYFASLALEDLSLFSPQVAAVDASNSFGVLVNTFARINVTVSINVLAAVNVAAAALVVVITQASVLGSGLTDGPYAFNYLTPPDPEDPLVLDLGSGPLSLTPLAGSQTYFDYSGSGFATQTGWLGPNEGILVLDDGSSTISASEIVGAQSGNGFADLLALDTNHDGVIDANDADFSKLKIWVNAVPGVNDSGQLVSLSALGVTSISLSVSPVNESIAGNEVVEQATFTINGVAHTISEVDFATNTVDTVYTPPNGFTYSPEALTLPELVGHGFLPNLQVAMTENSTLLSEVQNLVLNVGSMSGQQFDSAFQTMVAEWAGASATNPGSQGTYVNAQHLAVVFAIYGINPAKEPIYQILPNWHSGPLWEQVYQSIIDQLEIRFVSQIKQSLSANGVDSSSNPLSVFSLISYDAGTDSVSVNFNQLLSTIVDNAPTDPTAAQEYYNLTFAVVRGLRGVMFGGSTSSLVAAVFPALDSLGVTPSIEQAILSLFGYGISNETSVAGSLDISTTSGVVVLGSGDKSISGGVGNTYLYSAAGGNDFISDSGSGASVLLSGLQSAHAILERPSAGSDLVIINPASGNALTIKNYFSAGNFASIIFSDGINLSVAGVMQVLAAEATQYMLSSNGVSDSFSQQQTELALVGFTSVTDEGDSTGSLKAVAPSEVVFIGTGDKTISGAGGANYYVYAADGGNVVVDDRASNGGQASTLVLNGIASTDISLSRPDGGGNLVITDNVTGYSVTVEGEFSHDGPLAAITFSDEVSWSLSQIEQMLLNQETAASGGTIWGFGSGNTLVAGLGDKYLVGEGGVNAYIYASADGNDVVQDSGNYVSTLEMTDIASTDVTLSRPNGGGSLVLTVTSTGKTVEVYGEFVNGGPLKAITFSDGVSWSQTQIEQMLIAQETAASSGTIYGFGGGNTLVAGLGDKYLVGEGGVNTYVYSSVDGNDVVQDSGNYVSTLQMTDIASTGVTLSRPDGGGSLVLTDTVTGKTVEVYGEFINGGPLAAITFSDGVSWTQSQIEQMLLSQETAASSGTIYGFGNGNTLVAGLGDKYLFGEGGVNTYVYASADGNDVVQDGGNFLSTLEMTDIASTDVTLSRPDGGGSLVLTVTSTGKTVEVYGEFVNGGPLAAITFSDGVSWSQAQVEQMLLDQETAANGGTVYGFGNGDTLVAGLGDKTLIGGGGVNTYVYSSADGNDVVEDSGNYLSTLELTDIASTDVALTRPSNGNNIVLTVNSTGKTITVENEFANGGPLKGITFSDGVTWNTAKILNLLGETPPIETALFALGDGQVTLSSGVSILQMGVGITESDVMLQANNNNSNLAIELRGDSTDSITIDGDLNSSNGTVTSGLTEIEFADGTTMSLGPAVWGVNPLTFTWAGAANETLTGSYWGANDFELGANDSVVFGQNSGNIVEYAKGDGNVSVNLNYGGTGILQLGAGITESDVMLQGNNNNGTLTVEFAGDATDSITVGGDLSNSNGTVTSGLTEIEFADGTTMSLSPAVWGVNPLTFTWAGSANETLTGSNWGDNVFEVGANDSVVFGNAGNSGTSENIIEYAKGDGNVSVNLNYGGTGILQLGAGVAESDVMLQGNNNNGTLTVEFAGDTTDSITVGGDLSNSNGTVTSGLTEIGFADGTTMSLGPAVWNVNPLTFTWSGTPGETLYGSNSGTNVFEVGANDGVVFGNRGGGGSGENIIEYAEGDGNINVNLNYGGIGILQLAAGITESDVMLQGNDNNGTLTVEFVGDPTDSITIGGDLSRNSWGISSAVSEIMFSDGTSMAVGQPAAGLGQALTFTWSGSTNSVLTGSSQGTNVFNVGFDNSVTFGQNSGNIIEYAKGDGNLNVSLNYGGTGILRLAAGITESDVMLQGNNDNGTLTVEFAGDPTDSIAIGGDLSSSNGTVTSGLTEIAFADGTMMSLSPAVWGVNPLTFTWAGPANATLTGSYWGANLFEVGANDTVIFAQNSGNIIEYAKGDGNLNVNLNYGGTGILQLGAGVTESDVMLQGNNNNGTLTVEFAGDTTDSITVGGDLSNSNGTVTSGLTEIGFADGTTMSLGPAVWGVNPLTFTWAGTANATLAGSNWGANLFEVGANDTVAFAQNGGNIIDYAEGDGHLNVQLNNGTGILKLASGITESDVLLQAVGNSNALTVAFAGNSTDSITIGGDLNNSAGTITSGLTEIEFADGTTMALGPAVWNVNPLTFTWIGTSNETLFGSNAGTNVFQVGAGDDVEFGNNQAGGSAANVIDYAEGDGNVNVQLNNGTGILKLAAGITESDVLLQAVGNSNALTIAFVGDSTDSVIIGGDLNNSGGHVTSALSEIEFADGTTMSLNQPTFTWVGTTSETLFGSNAGTNVFEVGTGGDVEFGNNQAGGTGVNIIDYAEGDGHVNVQLNNGTGILTLAAGVTESDVLLQAVGNSNALTIAFVGDSADSVIIGGDLNNSGGHVTSALSEIEFADGTTMSLNQPTFTWVGTANETLFGSNAGTNVFELGAGDDVEFGNNQAGGSGANVIDYAEGDGNVNVQLNNGTGILKLAAGITESDVLLQAVGNSNALTIAFAGDATDSIVIGNDLSRNSWGISSAVSEIEFSDGTTLAVGQPSAGQGQPLTYTWGGTSGATLSGGNSGTNMFELGGGAETAIGGNTQAGGNGSNFYEVSANTGQATIVTNEDSGTLNELDFTGEISDEQLWFAQSGNNLNIDLMGTTTKVTVQNWFSGSSNQLQEITAGGFKIDSEISQLVQAMATYSAASPGFDPTSSSNRTLPNDPTLQSAVGAAWHS